MLVSSLLMSFIMVTVEGSSPKRCCSSGDNSLSEFACSPSLSSSSEHASNRENRFCLGGLP